MTNCAGRGGYIVGTCLTAVLEIATRLSPIILLSHHVDALIHQLSVSITHSLFHSRGLKPTFITNPSRRVDCLLPVRTDYTGYSPVSFLLMAFARWRQRAPHLYYTPIGIRTAVPIAPCRVVLSIPTRLFQNSNVALHSHLST